MKIQLGFLLILACSVSSAAEPIECRVFNPGGASRDFFLARDISPAFDGARSTMRFYEHGTNFGTHTFCEGPETENNADQKGPVNLSGILKNSGGDCELNLDSSGKGQYTVKIRPLSMGSSPGVYSYSVNCRF